jgi:hypothetical protein
LPVRECAGGCTSEDFVASRLPQLLRYFVRTRQRVDDELTVGLSGELTRSSAAASSISARRRPGEDRRRVVSQDRLVWCRAIRAASTRPRLCRSFSTAAQNHPRDRACDAARPPLAHRVHPQRIARGGARRARRHRCRGGADPARDWRRSPIAMACPISTRWIFVPLEASWKMRGPAPELAAAILATIIGLQ